MVKKYDLVGDIHGQIDALTEMLNKLEYRHSGEQWSPPDNHHLLFLGDLIDRGPNNRETVKTVRALVEQGVATCLMGNHEFNAVQFHTEHPGRPDHFLRKHDKKNKKQHQNFLNEYADHPAELKSVMDWFTSLPVAIETPYFRAVHACWSAEHLKNLSDREGFWYMGYTSWVAAILIMTSAALCGGARDAGFEGASRASSACTAGSADDHALGTLISGGIPPGFGVERPRMHS